VAQALRPYVPEILSTLQQAAAADNEEIALLCLRVMFDLYKNFRPAPDEQIKTLCELVHQVSFGPGLSDVRWFLVLCRLVMRVSRS